MKAIFVYVLLGFAKLALAQSEMNLSQIKMNLQNADEALKVSAVKSLMQEVNSRTRSQGSREALATSLVSTGELLAPVNTELISLAKDESPRMRASAALLLGYSIQTKETTATLVALGKDEVPDVQYAALRSIFLANAQTPEARELAVDLLKHTDNSSLFRDAANIGSAWKIAEAIEPLMQGLINENPHFKVYAAGAFADMGVKNAVPEMRKQLEGISDPSLRSLMLNAIERLENPPPQAVAPPATTAQTTPIPSMATPDYQPKSVTSPTPIIQAELPKTVLCPWIIGAILLLAVAGGIFFKFLRK
jgi:HEAT repeat protein